MEPHKLMLQAVRRSRRGKAFAEPVSEGDAPGYRDVIERPLDLGTVIEGIYKGAYSSPGTSHTSAGIVDPIDASTSLPRIHTLASWQPSAVKPLSTSKAIWCLPHSKSCQCAEAIAEDVALVWRNCTAFNGEGSDIDRTRVKAQVMFEEAWLRAQLPLARPEGGTATLLHVTWPTQSKPAELCKLFDEAWLHAQLPVAHSEDGAAGSAGSTVLDCVCVSPAWSTMPPGAVGS